MEFDIITIFPEIFRSYLSESLIHKAQKNKLIKINIHNLRKWAKGKHKIVDDRPYGGGLGMVLKVEPIYKAVNSLKLKSKRLGFKNQKSKVVVFSPRGEKFDQKMAYRFSKLDQLILICGRYEGVDERVSKYIADFEISIGDYDLMGGELPAMVLIEAVARLIPGVLGKPQLLKERITKSKGFVEYPQYTRPTDFFTGKIKNNKPEIWRVPKVLLSGDHKKIEEWRKRYAKIIEK